jgi:hypothetical protein
MKTMIIEQLSEKYISYVQDIIKQRWQIQESEALAEINRWISPDNNSVCFVGVIDGTAMAIGIFDVESKVDASIRSWNRQLFVEPVYRGNLYGHQLTYKRFIWAKERGYEYVYLATETAKLYHSKFGWETVREEKVNGVIQTIMRFDLSKLSFPMAV